MHNLKMGFIRGVYHPKPVNDPSYQGRTFREDEAEFVGLEFVGAPVYVEHNPEIVVGRVERTRRGPGGTLECDIFVDESSSLGRRVMDDVRSRQLRGLSIGGAVSHRPDDGSYDGFMLDEVSLVEEGLLPDTHIYAYDNGDSSVIIDVAAYSSLVQGTPLPSHNSESTPQPKKMENFNKAANVASEGTDAMKALMERAAAAEAEAAAAKAEAAAAKAKIEVFAKKEADARAAQTYNMLYDKEDGILSWREKDEIMTDIPASDLSKTCEEVVSRGGDDAQFLLQLAYSVSKVGRVYAQRYEKEMTEAKQQLEAKDRALQEKEQYINTLVSKPSIEEKMFCSKAERVAGGGVAAAAQKAAANGDFTSDLVRQALAKEHARRETIRQPMQYSAASASADASAAAPAHQPMMSLSDMIKRGPSVARIFDSEVVKAQQAQQQQ
jgi:hypothetical protein